MITAIDSSILLDVLTNDPTFARPSLEAMQAASAVGSLIVCPIVWSEIHGAFSEPGPLQRALDRANIAFDPFDRTCADLAGEMWRTYRKRGGTRVRLVADFLIGAHAMTRGRRLLTRDRGFFREYFDLELLGTGA